MWLPSLALTEQKLVELSSELHSNLVIQNWAKCDRRGFDDKVTMKNKLLNDSPDVRLVLFPSKALPRRAVVYSRQKGVVLQGLPLRPSRCVWRAGERSLRGAPGWCLQASERFFPEVTVPFYK